ncbi:hypothetical protein GCM10009117_00490 [Gangjinia marincola]|uniref:Uncharacterized protein n=1 Tax=Gangjinia marincola TaxID=578463 RepID=A0ABN1MCW6_9FLAO
MKNIDDLAEMYTKLLEDKNLNLSGLSYEHSKLDSLKNQAYLKALKKADLLAEELVQQLPESSKEVLKIGNTKLTASHPQSQPSYNYEMIEEEVSKVQNRSVAINPGMISVYATLFVEYQID